MEKELKKWSYISRLSVIFNLTISSVGFIIWGLLVTRSSEFIQRGYYYYDGTMMMALSLFLVFPIMVFVYYFFSFKKIRRINLIFQLCSAGLGYAILYNYLLLIKTTAEPPYILIGQFIQDNIALVLSHFVCNFILFLVNFLLLVTPHKMKIISRGESYNDESEPRVGFTAGIGISPRVTNKNLLSKDNSELRYRVNIGFGLGGGILLTALLAIDIHENGPILFFYFSYVSILISAFMFWLSYRKMVKNGATIDLEVPAGHFFNRNNLELYGMFSLGVLVMVIVGIRNLPIMETIPFLLIFLVVFLILAILRLLIDSSMKPQKESDDVNKAIFRKMRKSSWTFGFYSLSGGLMLLASR